MRRDLVKFGIIERRATTRLRIGTIEAQAWAAVVASEAEEGSGEGGEAGWSRGRRAWGSAVHVHRWRIHPALHEADELHRALSQQACEAQALHGLSLGLLRVSLLLLP